MTTPSTETSRAQVLLVGDVGELDEVAEALADTVADVHAASPSDAPERLAQLPIHVVVLAVAAHADAAWLLLAFIRERYPHIGVIMAARHGSVQDAVEAIRRGAADYIITPAKIDELQLAVLQVWQQQGDVVPSQERSIVGRSPAIRQLHTLIQKVSPTDASVLILGESGTGKELVALELHKQSRRAKHQFVAVNCAAMAEGVLESELFGHERGAFTGALGQRIGRFELAHDGTLFLDEIGDLSRSAQLKLLRAIEERQIERVGAASPINVDVRFIAATNRDLEQAVKQRQFRPELFYRIQVVTLHLPPLRERREDIPLLLNHFFQRFCREYDRDLLRCRREVIQRLYTYAWPGNIRELRNTVESLVVSAKSSVLELEDLPRRIQAASLDTSICLPLGQELREMERTYILRTLEHQAGDRERAASSLGISSRTLQRRMREYGITSAPTPWPLETS